MVSLYQPFIFHCLAGQAKCSAAKRDRVYFMYLRFYPYAVFRSSIIRGLDGTPCINGGLPVANFLNSAQSGKANIKGIVRAVNIIIHQRKKIPYIRRGVIGWSGEACYVSSKSLGLKSVGASFF